MGDNVIDIGRRVRQRPGPQRQARLQALRAAEAEHEANDGVVRAAVDATSAELLQLQLVELAREAAILKFDRMQATDARERQRICSRRVRALKAVATAAVELHRLDAGASSPGVMRRVLDLLLVDVLGAAAEVLDGKSADRFAAAARKRLGSGLMDELSRVH